MSIKLVLNHAGIKQLLTSEEMQRELERRAQRIASQARSGAGGMEIAVENKTGNRARFRIVCRDPLAKRAEARSRFLGRAMDAGR